MIHDTFWVELSVLSSIIKELGELPISLIRSFIMHGAITFFISIEHLVRCNFMFLNTSESGLRFPNNLVMRFTVFVEECSAMNAVNRNSAILQFSVCGLTNRSGLQVFATLSNFTAFSCFLLFPCSISPFLCAFIFTRQNLQNAVAVLVGSGAIQSKMEHYLKDFLYNSKKLMSTSRHDIRSV